MEQQLTHTRTCRPIRQKSASIATEPRMPTRASVHPLLQLQQTIGNQAVQRVLQAKLKIGPPGDKY